MDEACALDHFHGLQDAPGDYNNPVPEKTYYEILDLDTSATSNEVKESFRLQAAAWHPDKHIGSNKKFAEDKMKLLNEAYGVLGNSDKRKEYDRKLAQQRNHHSKERDEVKQARSDKPDKNAAPSAQKVSDQENVKRQAPEPSEAESSARQKGEDYFKDPEEYRRILRQKVEARVKAARQEQEERVRAARQRCEAARDATWQKHMGRGGASTKSSQAMHTPLTQDRPKHQLISISFSPIVEMALLFTGVVVGTTIGANIDVWMYYVNSSPNTQFTEKLLLALTFIIFAGLSFFLTRRILGGASVNIAAASVIFAPFLIFFICPSGTVKQILIRSFCFSSICGSFLGLAIVSTIIEFLSPARTPIPSAQSE
ncbi:MAG TPA: J domain-containing protein [Abditibacteriaceae bacterium]